ncbi:hypothetical protein ACN6K9_000385 [Streptomyces sp. SAS_267]|uniref:hypothetical protein n=1 Tax=Streptomyces sp. SAS_267 TaxID=3412750 RepID=UPI00403C1793
MTTDSAGPGAPHELADPNDPDRSGSATPAPTSPGLTTAPATRIPATAIPAMAGPTTSPGTTAGPGTGDERPAHPTGPFGDEDGAGSLAGSGAGGGDPVRGIAPLSEGDSAREASHGPRGSAGRRGAVDPVKALLHRHRELCERAVDPLEIAAGLEAHGVTDRTAARLRHRDVFSLSEEMYARAARDGETAPRTEPPGRHGPRPYWAALALVPGLLGTAVVVGLRLTDGQPRSAVAAFGALAVASGLYLAFRRGPLSTPHRTTGAARVGACWLIAYALAGDGLLSAARHGGPHGPWPLAAAPVLALLLACAPAAWCAHLFAARARGRLGASRGLEEFAASVRPLLLGAFGLFAAALCGLLALCGTALDEPPAYAGAGALGALILLARLLTARGFTRVPGRALAGAGVVEATALAMAFASRLPGCSFLAAPVDSLVEAAGAGAVPALACGAGALVLLVQATRTLTHASAHALPREAP